MQLQEERASVLDLFNQLLAVPEPDAASGTGGRPSLAATPEADLRVKVVLEAIAAVARADGKGLGVCRKQSLGQLLFGAVARRGELRRSLVGCVGVVTGNRLRDTGHRGLDLYGDRKEALGEEEKKFRESLAKFVVLPLLSEVSLCLRY